MLMRLAVGQCVRRDPTQLRAQDAVVVVAQWMQQRGTYFRALDAQTHTGFKISKHDAVADDLRACFESVGKLQFDHAARGHDDRTVGKRVGADRHEHHGVERRVHDRATAGEGIGRCQ
jgi:hypothetical protein